MVIDGTGGTVELDIITLTSKEAFLHFESYGNLVSNGFRIHYEYSEESPGGTIVFLLIN